VRTLIRGGWIVGYQHDRHALIRGGVVVFEDDRVIHVGPSYDGEFDQEIDASGCLVSPGFINIHAVANIDVQTLALDVARSGFVSSRAYAVEGTGDLEFSGQQLKTSALFSLAELLRGGSTTIVEITTMAPARLDVSREEVPALVAAAEQLGARIYVSHKFRPVKRYLDADGEVSVYSDDDEYRSAVAYALDVVDTYENTLDGRMKTMFFPYAFGGFKPDQLAEIKRLAIERDVPVHMHTSQSLAEFHACLRNYGKTPVGLLDEAGFLDEQTILTHLLYTSGHRQSGFPPGDRSDLEIVAARGSHVAHCSVVYARRGKALESFGRLRAAGINVPLGTDTYPQDMIEEMRWTALAGKFVDRDTTAVTVADVYNSATLAGAKALGRDDIGRLGPGSKADITVIDLSGLHIGPVDDPIRSLVYAASSADVRNVFVDGRAVVEGGKVVGLDERDLAAKAAEAHIWQRDRFVEQHPRHETAATLFPPTLRPFDRHLGDPR
jgi:5-methylthioadenosine/S-adenosylhomocysteine deaminase